MSLSLFKKKVCLAAALTLLALGAALLTATSVRFSKIDKKNWSIKKRKVFENKSNSRIFELLTATSVRF